MFSKQLKYILLASGLYLPTTILIHEMAILLIIPAFFIIEYSTLKSKWIEFKSQPLDKRYLRSFWIIVLFFFIALINKFLNGFELLCKKDYYSFFYLVPFTIIISPLFHKKTVIKTFAIWVAVEVVVGCIEYFIGSRSILMDFPINEISDYSLFYNSRVYGLSTNSSVLAVKVFIAFILLMREIRFNSYLWSVFFVTFIIGVLLSFNRGVFLALVFLFALVLMSKLFLYFKAKYLSKANIVVVISCGACLVALAVAPKYWKEQLTRGDKSVTLSNESYSEIGDAPVESCSNQNGPTLQPITSEDFKNEEWLVALTKKIELSGRQQFWVNYLDFINENPLFGNGSNKLYFRVYSNLTDNWKNVHAHNSYFMLIASHGLILTILFFLFIILNLKKETLLLVIVIAVYSFVQYGIFWGFSILDLVFFSLLFLPKSIPDES